MKDAESNANTNIFTMPTHLKGENLLAKLRQKQLKSILDGLPDEAQKRILSSDMPEVSGYRPVINFFPNSDPHLETRLTPIIKSLQNILKG